jgi:hypothetical protein
MLLMDIQHGGNPIIDLLQSTVEHVQDSFKSGSLASQCSAFEEVVPFWGVLCGFLHEHSEQKFTSVATKVDAMFVDLVREFNAANRKVLGKIKDSVRIGEQFNTELHTGVRRTYAIWALPMPNAAVAPLVREMHADLRSWYESYIRESCRVILGASDPGVRLTKFLLELLDVADLFSPTVYRDLVLTPIYGIYDSFHEDAVVADRTDLVAAINAVSNLTTTNLDLLIGRCNGVLRMQLIDPANDDLIGVGAQLRSMMLEKLLRGLMSGLDSAVYHGFFGAGIDWTGDVPVELEGYTVLIVNKCIDCKCAWGALYDELRPKIVEHVIASLLHSVANCTKLGPTGAARVDANLKILERAFGKDAEQLWKIIEAAIDERRSGTSVNPAAAIARIEKVMRLQLAALA